MSRLLKTLALTSVLTASLAAQAITVSEYSVQTSIDFDFQEVRVVNSFDGQISTQSGVLPHGFAAGTSNVDYGVNKVSSRLVSDDFDNPFQIGTAFSSAQWWDLVTIDDPNLNGTTGTLSASLDVLGTGNVTMHENWVNNVDWYGARFAWVAGIEVSTDLETFTTEAWFGDWLPNPDTGQLEYYGHELNQIQPELTFEFIYGQPFIIGAFLQTDLTILPQDIDFNPINGTVDATLDLGHSAYWAGMKVYDQNGNLVNSATLSSQSGVNWFNPVPEPTTALLILPLLALAKRRRQSK